MSIGKRILSWLALPVIVWIAVQIGLAGGLLFLAIGATIFTILGALAIPILKLATDIRRERAIKQRNMKAVTHAKTSQPLPLSDEDDLPDFLKRR